MDESDVCPIAIVDSSVNITNHLSCITEANLGPANPEELNDTFWAIMADTWAIPVEEARYRQCQNCEYYDNSPGILECLQTSTFKASELPVTPQWADTETGAGYCTKWDLTCSATRTCATWEEDCDTGQQEEEDSLTVYEGDPNMSLTGPKYFNKVFTLDSVIKAVDPMDNSEELRIEGYASTNSIDRASDVILASAWTKSQGLKNFTQNPILLFNHDYDKPVGKVVEIITDTRGLKIKGVISQSASSNVYNLVKEGVLSTFSVGFLIKDADYNRETDGLIVKDAELLEVSVVSVPCNQDATFSVAKSFDNPEDYLKFRKQFETALVGQPSAKLEGSSEGATASRKTYTMNEELQTTIATEVAKLMAEKTASEKAASEKAASEKAAADALTTRVVETAGERIYAELEKRLSTKEIDLDKQLGDLKTELAEKSEELKAIANSKRVFSDRGSSTSEWKKQFAGEMEDAFLLARITGKGYNTDFAKDLLQKVNTFSSEQVSSDNFEREVNLNIERDIWLELILAPMFREIPMTSAAMAIPVAPDTNYATITSASNIPGTNPGGLLDPRGTAVGTGGGIALTEIELRTVKMVAKTYLNNDTEEDSLIPILPLLRDNMIRQHARGVENMILLGGMSATPEPNSAYPTITAAQGLLKYASTNSRTVTAAGAATPLTAAALLGLRKNMGKYGLRPSDIVYVVSLQGYFELIEDAEFQDFNLVNQAATKLTGEVGQVFGSPVLVCDEFSAAATGRYYAAAINKRNFVVPRQRGITVESQYLVENQHKVLATTQRLGFKEIIPNAKSVVGLKYA